MQTVAFHCGDVTWHRLLVARSFKIRCLRLHDFALPNASEMFSHNVITRYRYLLHPELKHKYFLFLSLSLAVPEKYFPLFHTFLSSSTLSCCFLNGSVFSSLFSNFSFPFHFFVMFTLYLFFNHFFKFFSLFLQSYIRFLSLKTFDLSFLPSFSLPFSTSHLIAFLTPLR